MAAEPVVITKIKQDIVAQELKLQRLHEEHAPADEINREENVLAALKTRLDMLRKEARMGHIF